MDFCPTVKEMYGMVRFQVLKLHVYQRGVLPTSSGRMTDATAGITASLEIGFSTIRGRREAAPLVLEQ
jgi:hypothetical protein